jgi:hypothetical protein
MSPGTNLLLGALALTSFGALLIGIWRLGLSPVGLRRAAGRALDCIGLGLLFLAANLAIGGVAVLGLRVATGGFVSLYILNDGAILALSLVQGLIVQWWREGAR